MDMEKATEMIVTVLMAVNAGLLLLAAVLWCRHSGFRWKNSGYDERQTADRAAAYRAGFLTVIVYDTLYLLLREAFGLVWCEELFGVGLGVMAGVGAFLLVCVRRDAIFRVGKKMDGYKFLLFAILFPCAAFTGMKGLDVIADGEFFRSGLVSDEALIVFAGLLFVPLWLVVFREYMAEQKRNRKAS